MTEALPEYYEFIFNMPDESREAVTNKIMELGSPGFFERDGNIIAYFEYRADIKGLCDELNGFRDVLKSSGLDSAFSFDYSLIPGQDWNESWKKSFTPIDVGDNLTIVPSWIKPDTDRIPVIIDPGMVFGTGHHETTRQCLAIIEKYAGNSGEKDFLDVGTGTGILAIGAARMGFGHVTGVDTDQLAVEAALYNVSLNGLKNVTIGKGSIADVSGVFDVIVANLLSEILVPIAGDIVSRLKPVGTAILSGMLIGQEEDVIRAMKDAGLVLNEKAVDGKWVTLILSLPPSSSRSACRCRETC
ncbi:MAG: 50S ribosomal protein L11 methyltransferase [Nitrospirae bacterium]|nr:50S ribosomal protein L11 methyltransferase [Nitrospirota bacterium]